MKVWALDHKNRTARNSIKMWHSRVRRWYSSNSKRTQTTVALPSAPIENFLFLHNNISAAAKYYHTKQSHKILSNYNFISHSINPHTIQLQPKAIRVLKNQFETKMVLKNRLWTKLVLNWFRSGLRAKPVLNWFSNYFF